MPRKDCHVAGKRRDCGCAAELRVITAASGRQRHSIGAPAALALPIKTQAQASAVRGVCCCCGCCGCGRSRTFGGCCCCGAAAAAAAAAAAMARLGGDCRARTRCVCQGGRALSPTREHDEVRNRVVAASTRTCSASHACRWQCRPRCPSPSASADPAAHRHRAPQRLPRARDPAPRRRAREQAHVLAALRTPTRRTKLLTAIECRGGGHVRDILRREVRPASTRET